MHRIIQLLASSKLRTVGSVIRPQQTGGFAKLKFAVVSRNAYNREGPVLGVCENTYPNV